jgi:hypothetical protein
MASPRARRLVLIAAITLALVSQVTVRSLAREVVRQVTAEAPADLDAAWERYRLAARFTLFDFGLGEAKRTLHSAALNAAERILDSYRQDRPTTRQADWRRAHGHLQRAAYLHSGDPSTQARLIYVQAQLDRIDAGTLRDQKQAEAADRKLNEAISGLGEAGRLAPDFPDPFLGLARIYAYQRFDFEALEEALDEAARRGYAPRDREKAQRADGHFTEGRRLYRRAREVIGEALQCALLEEAADHLDAAAAGYEEILDYGKSRANRSDAWRLIGGIEERLADLRCPLGDTVP